MTRLRSVRSSRTSVMAMRSNWDSISATKWIAAALRRLRRRRLPNSRMFHVARLRVSSRMDGGICAS